MKKVIFVGGTSFSGSTFFHLMLANDPKGFALGETRYLFHPQRLEDVNRLCSCGDPACEVWQHIRRNREDHIYQSVFELFPEVEFIVDSSKQPFWIRSQGSQLGRSGIAVENLLIWKTPLEFAASSKKRKRFENWDAEWLNYHRLYFSLIPRWKAVPYAQLTNDETALRRACEQVDIPWFPQKQEYWHRRYHAFGGNRSATFHLYDTQAAKEQLKDHYDQNKMRLYRRIYKNEIEDENLKQVVEQCVTDKPLFQSVLHVLEENSVYNDSARMADMGDLRLPEWLVNLRRLKMITKEQIAKYKLNRQVADDAAQSH